MSETNSTVVVQSEVMPGVSYTIRRMSYGLRGRIRRRLVKALSQIREKTDEIDQLVEEHGIDKSADEVAQDAATTGIVELELDESNTAQPKKPGARFSGIQLRVIEKIEDISREVDIITQTESDPVYLQECFVSIDGYKVDGEVPNWQLLLESGDEKLCEEIIQAIKAEAGLTVKVKENLSLPTTSGAAAGGPMTDTTAPPVSATDGGSDETAIGTSQNT